MPEYDNHKATPDQMSSQEEIRDALRWGRREADYTTTGAGNGPDGQPRKLWGFDPSNGAPVFAPAGDDPPGRTDRPADYASQRTATGYSGGGAEGASKPKRRWLRRLLPFALVLLVGVGVGAAGNGSPEPQTVPGPERIVNIPGPERVVEKQVKVPTTPQSCLQALDLADKGFVIASDAFTVVSEAFDAVGNFDADALSKSVQDLKTVSGRFQALSPKYQAAKAECRASR